MSDPKRGTLITVGAPNSAKKIVNKTVRLTINLVESNESKYPELNYKELVIAEEKKKRLENGKTPGLDPFSDNDDDVERVARKFEQKYGGKSTYGKKKSRSKTDDFADIGAGYDENDSFIDNTHGYDEMIPPECDTLHGGFYINCGSLEFKSVEHTGTPDEPRRNKRRISSSSSEEESSDSSSDSESDEKDKPMTNGTVHSHDTEHRKKKNKKDKQKAKKLRTDSSAANSGKQTSDDNNHADAEGESVDSRTSHSDSLTSKPAPSSENAITSDSSRDLDSKMDCKLPPTVTQVLDALESSIAKYLIEHPTTPATQLLANNDAHIQRLEQTLKKCGCNSRITRLARNQAARALGVSRAKLMQRVGSHAETQAPPAAEPVQPTTAPTTVPSATADHKRKLDEEDELDVTALSDDLREAQIVNTLKKLMDLIEEKKPSMFANYNLECERVREEKRKLTSDGASHVEKRLPKRRFPWCHRSRALLARITKLAGSQHAAAALLADKVLPMFPKGFVRMPTLMRQANINKDVKVPEMKRQRLGSASHLNHTQPLNHVPTTAPTTPVFPDQIQFPSSLTVTTTLKQSPEKEPLGYIMNSFSLNKDLIVEKEDKREDYKKEDKRKEEVYIPPNNIGSITITPVPNKEKKPDKQAKPETKGLIRVKSPAALNESVKTKKETKPITNKRPENPITNTKDKRIETLPVKDKKELPKDKKNEPIKDKRIEPLQIDTSFPTAKKNPSPKTKEDALSQKQIESLRVKENNIPRPALVPVHHSPTFAKPDKRPPEIKKKKDDKVDVDLKKTDEKIDTDVKRRDEKVMIVSDLDPLADQEPVAVDDSSSDVEVIENDKSEVPLRDQVIKSVPKTNVNDGGDVDIVMTNVSDMKGKVDDPTEEDIDVVMRNIREMESSQETTKFSSNSFGPVVLNGAGAKDLRRRLKRKEPTLHLRKPESQNEML